MGSSAGEDLLEGYNNIFLGSDAGETLVEGDNNIFLGGDTGVLVESNTIRIGAMGTHTDTFIAGQVAIGTSDAPGNQPDRNKWHL